MADDSAAVVAMEKWGLPLQELYRLAQQFYKQNNGKALHLSYEDNLKLIALKQQASLGRFDAAHAPALGVLDVIGRDRRQHWQMLGDMSREQAMEGFIDLLHKMCSAFHPYIEAVKQSRDEALKEELKRMEQEKREREQREREQQEKLEEGYKEELQRRQLQDELNKQTYQQFKSYAEKQFPGNPDQQALLIHQLQQEHYHQYMQQLQIHSDSNVPSSVVVVNKDDSPTLESSTSLQNQSFKGTSVIGSEPHTECKEENCCPAGVGDEEKVDGDYPLIKPPKMWTRPDIEAFKADVSSGDGDGVITVGHGDTVTVRVPTNPNGKCLFWEFATDNYDIGFGIYFEWSKPATNEVTVHVSESDDDDDLLDDDNLSSTEDLEGGTLNSSDVALYNEMTTAAMYSAKPPISIIIPIYRRECFNEVYVGSHSFPGEGVYLLKFDNTYSIWRSKTLYYRVFYER